MAFLDKNERQKLAQELKDIGFRPAKGKLRRMDPQCRLAFYRNVQSVNHWVTRFELKSLGARVTMIEKLAQHEHKSGKMTADYELVEVIVEPTPENKT
ncbi:MAG: hypothetical protein IT298_14020 [Chloroflexi bacterium]|nr:MAG: hypothetical protein UZ13_03523 [Chloroflexi bacterium OLB13]MBV6437983.1 hypothetical protein [Anaerolineae bacterium]MCC6566871.1 hypothetical protein [Chloroflexota bacterium]MDL1916987.1 hypothetical protein [Anaerolineae bacterium CFX4]MBW7880025.1 hypothetical protein [Anaerolineae bacterium]